VGLTAQALNFTGWLDGNDRHYRPLLVCDFEY